MSLSKTTRFDVATTVFKPVATGPVHAGLRGNRPSRRPVVLCCAPAGIHFDDQYIEGKTIGKEPYYLVNTDRAVGTRLAGDIARRQRAEGKIQPVELNYKGAAGQSFMAFAVSEMKVSLEGDANDYVCKGLSGAHVSIFRLGRPRRTGSSRPRTVLLSATRACMARRRASSSPLGSRVIRFGVRNPVSKRSSRAPATTAAST